MRKQLIALLLLLVMTLSGAVHIHSHDTMHKTDGSIHQCLACQGSLVTFDSAAPLHRVYLHCVHSLAAQNPVALPQHLLAAHTERAPPQA